MIGLFDGLERDNMIHLVMGPLIHNCSYAWPLHNREQFSKSLGRLSFHLKDGNSTSFEQLQSIKHLTKCSSTEIFASYSHRHACLRIRCQLHTFSARITLVA